MLTAKQTFKKISPLIIVCWIFVAAYTGLSQSTSKTVTHEIKGWYQTHDPLDVWEFGAELINPDWEATTGIELILENLKDSSRQTLQSMFESRAADIQAGSKIEGTIKVRVLLYPIPLHSPMPLASEVSIRTKIHFPPTVRENEKHVPAHTHHFELGEPVLLKREVLFPTGQAVTSGPPQGNIEDRILMENASHRLLLRITKTTLAEEASSTGP